MINIFCLNFHHFVLVFSLTSFPFFSFSALFFTLIHFWYFTLLGQLILKNVLNLGLSEVFSSIDLGYSPWQECFRIDNRVFITFYKVKWSHSVVSGFLRPFELQPCSPPGSSVRGIFQARILEWVAIFFSRGSSQPRDRTQIFHIAGRLFTLWARRGSHVLSGNMRSQVYSRGIGRHTCLHLSRFSFCLSSLPHFTAGLRPCSLL